MIVTIAGLRSGRITEKNRRIGEAPSIMAASSISRGMVPMKARKMIVAKGNVSRGASYQFVDKDCPDSNCYYRLEEVTLDGRSSFYKPTMVSMPVSAHESRPIPFTFGLQQNYPNPFNPSTFISYSLPVGGHVNLSIYDVKGRLVNQLVAQYQNEGFYDILWDGTDTSNSRVSSGSYIYRLQTENQTAVKKMALVR